MSKTRRKQSSKTIPGEASVPSGIKGMDTILRGGYPLARPSVIRGTSGTGKTLFALHYACTLQTSDTPVVYATFDESIQNLEVLARKLGHKRLPTFLDFTVDQGVEVSGDIELGGLLARIELAVDKEGSGYLVLDALDVLIAALGDSPRIRRDLNRLFDWCRKRSITLLATTGEASDYREGTDFMDYASDCSIRLQQTMENGVMTRKVHIVKCRGREHGTNNYPFIIDARGVSVMPVTDTGMSITVRRKRLSTGIKGLDDMLAGRGLWSGNTTMISGESGTGKSLMVMQIARESCEQGHNVLYCSFEEPADQLIRDARSIGIDLKAFSQTESLHIMSRRSVEVGLEQHIIHVLRAIEEQSPDVVVLDPISALKDMGDARDFKNTVLRLCHILKNRGITAVLTELIPDDSGGKSSMNVSSLVDTWIRLRRSEEDREMKRLVYIHKSRGSATDSRVRELTIKSKGLFIE